MAYLLTAIMTGGVAAILSLVTGGSLADIAWNYVFFGYLGMGALFTAALMSNKLDDNA